jgi:hypothetical protein
MHDRRGEKYFAQTIQKATTDNDMNSIPLKTTNSIYRGCRDSYCWTHYTAGRKIFRPYGMGVISRYREGYRNT